MLTKEVFSIEECFAVCAGREVAAPVPELEVNVVDVTFPFILAAEGLGTGGEGKEAGEWALLWGRCGGGGGDSGSGGIGSAGSSGGWR
jgi:hypothetical protein